MPLNEPTHGDILEKLGELKGQVATLISLVAQKREDIQAIDGRVGLLERNTASREELGEMDKRLNGIEKEMAKELGKWAGIVLAGSLVLTLVMPRLQEGLGIVEQKAEQRLERMQ